MAAPPHILALDFDGVLLDGLPEYFQTAWRAYCQIWQPREVIPPAGVADRFYRLRPVIETGWEMPVLVRAIVTGIPDDAVLADWPSVLQSRVAREELDRVVLARAVDGIRDRWIASDLEGWLASQRFYPGAIARLEQLLASEVEIYIVSTKEGRFIHKLSSQAGIELPRDRIFGKEIGQPKYETLRQLLQASGNLPSSCLWFVEDRLKALRLVQQQPDLQNVGLFLATWGYNTERDRQAIGGDRFIHLLSLNCFRQSLSHWPIEPNCSQPHKSL
ncbi:HAD family hydrolase [Synechococcus sp. PCC 7336]|uniref:HAD family hydrolase n=1 Tax=Synechococcus sp. PCC 7336 TaxID=195250 RepID=UPI00034B0E6C|nr:HAD family hydrolase [Synechococcus sp. PCC 7336]